LDLEGDIRAAARRLGFALCGFARIRRPPHAEFVSRWLADGNAASMAYIERGLAKRLDPHLVLPAARSVITLGCRYLPPPLPPIDWQRALRGRIAAYALGTDYHLVIERKLQSLCAFINGLRSGAAAGPASMRPYVDTGPVLEREWAAGGGVGWFGKNTNILHTEEGSWFFLAEILTTLELEPDAPLADHCGTCTRCMDLCPTAALAPGYVLDARLCISYLTIEHRGPIPIELRAKLGNWIFGCDVCQEVCPWNEKLARREGTPETHALLPYLPDLLMLSDDEFRARFRNSAVRRAKREGLARNVAVALGNTRNPAALQALAAALAHDPSVLVRGHAAWAVAAIGGQSARAILEQSRRNQRDGTVGAEIAHGLAALE
jgi:epoxyqueuosine reductase